MYNNDGINRRYSEGYKLKVLAELTTGKYNKTELSKIYGIQYGRKDLKNTRVTVGTYQSPTKRRQRDLLLKKGQPDA